jgi:hypothetical protein
MTMEAKLQHPEQYMPEEQTLAAVRDGGPNRAES